MNPQQETKVENIKTDKGIYKFPFLFLFLCI